nr:reverse transcriptase domain-containing protein [Tanacetum cinerariifolium]
MPRDALTIIKNKSKLRTSRNKPVVSKLNTTTSSLSPSLDITALTDIIKELVLINKANQQDFMKAIEETCVTCGGLYTYYECLATDSNTFNASAATGTCNQGGNEYRPQRGLNCHICNMKTELKNEFKTTMLNQNNELRNMMSNEIKNIMSSFIQMQSPSSSRSLPSNTIANSRGNIKAITTRSGVSYDGPAIPPTPFPFPKVVERETKVTTDKVQTTNPESTAHVQPSVVQVPTLERVVVLKPNPKPSIPYPSRLNDQRLQDKTNSQMLKLLQIFQILHFDLSFADSLLYIPMFAFMFKSLLGKFTFSADFIVINYDVDPCVPLILGRPFLRTAYALVDSDNDEWKKLLYGDRYKDIDSEKDKNKDSKIKSSIVEAHVVESNDLLPWLLDNDSTLLEESSEIASLSSSPFKNKNKMFNQGKLILHGTQIFNDESKDKELILKDRNFLSISSDKELLFFLELTVIETLLSFSSKNKDKVLNPNILTSKGVHSFILRLSHWTYNTFKIINIHLNIFNKGPMKIFLFFCFYL